MAVITGLDPVIHREAELGGYVYMMASKRHGTLYTGMTAFLAERGFQHREGTGSHFTAKYGVKLLVWYEHHDRIEIAIQREKNIKHWPRRWKIELIEQLNPDWKDLYQTLNH